MATSDGGAGGTAMAEQGAAELLGVEVREGYAEVGDQRLHDVEAGEGPLIVLPSAVNDPPWDHERGKRS